VALRLGTLGRATHHKQVLCEKAWQVCANFNSYKDLMDDAGCLLESFEPAILNPGQRLHRAHVITTTSGRNAIVLQLHRQVVYVMVRKTEKASFFCPSIFTYTHQQHSVQLRGESEPWK
jgi:hypothetical protein